MHPNEELIRNGYEAFAKGDVAFLNELFPDDIVFHVPGRARFAGTYQGKNAVFGFFSKLMDFYGAGLETHVHDVMANDEHAVALINFHAHRGDQTLDGNTVHVWHIVDSRPAEVWVHPGDLYASDAFEA